MTYLDVYPADGISPAAERFVQQCSPVFELYTRALHAGEAKIAATASWTRITLTDQPVEHSQDVLLAPDFAVPDEDPPDNFGISDGGWARFDPDLVTLPPEDRGVAYLDWLHDKMVLLGQLRGWEQQPLEDARRYCLDRGVIATFDGPRRRSPDRRHTAVLTLHIDPDGLRHLTIIVQDRTRTVVAERETVLRPYWCSFHTWRTVRNRFRWTSPTTVAADDRIAIGGELVPPALALVDIAVDLDEHQ